jgi:hypothetical protein
MHILHIPYHCQATAASSPVYQAALYLIVELLEGCCRALLPLLERLHVNEEVYSATGLLRLC